MRFDRFENRQSEKHIDPGEAALASAGLDFLGGLGSSSSASKNARQNRQFQRELLQDSIKWRVKDAKQAGIHPLYALGAPTVSAQNQRVGDSGQKYRALSKGVENYTQGKLQEAQIEKLNAETDFVKEQAQASKLARLKAGQNYSQDGIVQPGAVRKHVKKRRGELHSNLAGDKVTTAMGHKIKIGPETPVNIIEEEYGELPALLYGTAKWLSDRNFFNAKKYGREFAKLAHKWKTDRRAAQRFYEGKKHFYGKYLTEYLKQRGK